MRPFNSLSDLTRQAVGFIGSRRAAKRPSRSGLIHFRKTGTNGLGRSPARSPMRCMSPPESFDPVLLRTVPFIELNDQLPREIFPGFKVHFVHSACMTFAHWT